jgi:hypothetical protein
VGESDEHFLSECEARDSLFPDFDWRGYATPVAAGAVAAG